MGMGIRITRIRFFGEIMDATAELYNAYVQGIEVESRKQFERYGGCIEDWVSAAHEAFIDACETYDDDSPWEFSTWFWWKMRGAFSIEQRVRRFPTSCGHNFDELHRASKFDLEKFTRSLGRDAQLVVRLTVESPHDLIDMLSHNDIRETVRAGLKTQLRRLGWPVARWIEAAFEIQEALSE
jgi:hypothetical protein